MKTTTKYFIPNDLKQYTADVDENGWNTDMSYKSLQRSIYIKTKQSNKPVDKKIILEYLQKNSLEVNSVPKKSKHPTKPKKHSKIYKLKQKRCPL